MEVPGAIMTFAPILTSPIRLQEECTNAVLSILGSAKLLDHGVGGAAVLRTTIARFLLK